MSGLTPPESDQTDAPATDDKRGPRTDGPCATVRDAIAGAAEILGGAEGLAAWVQADTKNAEKFWTTLYPRLIPLQVTSEDGGPIRIAAAIEAARKRARAFGASPDPALQRKLASQESSEPQVPHEAPTFVGQDGASQGGNEA